MLLKRSIVLVATAAVISSLSVAGTATAKTEPLPAFGSQFHATWTDYTDAQRDVVLDRLAAVGARWVRIDVGWVTLEPRRSGRFTQWYLHSLDRAVDGAHRRGLSVLLTVLDTPRWANGGGDTNVPPRRPDRFGKLLGRLAYRYAGRVDAYEVWNEPNDDVFFDGSPEQYVGVLKAAYRAVKKADPTAKVVGGATEYNDDAFLEDVYRAGGRGFFDVWSTHPYQGAADEPPETPDDGNVWTMDHVGAVRAVMAEHHDRRPIWFTEFGWSNHPTASDAPPYKRGVSKAKQADYLVRSLRYAAAHYPYVKVMIWYAERDQATGDPHQDHYGLMTRNLKPKPVYLAVAQLLHRRADDARA